MNNTYTIVGNEFVLDRFVESGKPIEHKRIVSFHGGRRDLDGIELFIYDWRIVDDEVTLIYKMRRDTYAPVYEDKFACRLETRELPKPGRNFEWSELYGCWRNKKTGVKSYV